MIQFGCTGFRSFGAATYIPAYYPVGSEARRYDSASPKIMLVFSTRLVQEWNNFKGVSVGNEFGSAGRPFQ